MADDVGVRPGLGLTPNAAEVIRGEARDRYPEECCGGLLGRSDEEGRRTVVRAVPVRNERSRERRRRYLLGPRQVLDLEDAAEREGLEVLGFFHSHPDHPAEPSEHDRRHAWPWYSYLIVAVDGGEPGAVRSWRLLDDRSSFEEEDVTLPEEAH